MITQVSGGGWGWGNYVKFGTKHVSLGLTIEVKIYTNYC